MTNLDWSSFFLSQIWILPSLIVYLVGIVLSIAFWQRHPTVSLLCLVAFLIFLGVLFIGAGTQFWLMGVRDSGSSPRAIGRIIGFLGIFRTLLGTVAWALLLAAVFGWRSAAANDQEGS